MSLVRVFLLMTLAAAGATDVQARTDDLLGTWLTEDGGTAVEIARCDNALCGQIVWLERATEEDGSERLDANNPDPALRSRPLLGLQVLSGCSGEPDGKGRWTDGELYDHESGKTYYRTTLSFEAPDTVRLKGSAGVVHNGRVVTSKFGRTQSWTRVDPAQLGG